MHEEMIIAGFGGQGVMLLGKMLAEASMEDGKNVSWLPSYGPEMRGGTANFQVIISDEPVGAPVIITSTILVAMNRPSLDKFAPSIITGGKVFINSSTIDVEPGRSDLTVYKVPANAIAEELGNLKVANMVMAGAIIRATGAATEESMLRVIEESLKGKKAALIELNGKALRKGMECLQGAASAR
jgi:2-oxoglutarate ferredoxin oxidoreductase subunit gamma